MAGENKQVGVAAIQKELAEERKAKSHREVYKFAVPDRVVAELGDKAIKTIGLVVLTSEEELRATKRAGGDSARLAWELAKQSLTRVDATVLREDDGSIDSAWRSMHPKIRMLVLTAYTKLHTPEQSEIDDFLGSQKVIVG